MAEQDSTGERSEEATPKRQQDARDKGQVARSRELITALLLLTSGVVFLTQGPAIFKAMLDLAARQFTISRKDIFHPDAVWQSLEHALILIGTSLLPLAILLILMTLLGSQLLGGFTLSVKAMQPKMNRMSPAKGLKRMFGTHALMELVKAIGKFFIIALIAFFFLRSNFEKILTLGTGDLQSAVVEGLQLLGTCFMVVCSGLMLIAFIDIPFQLWQHNKQMKMTKQEIRDEYKDTEGKPEVKSKVRQMQMQIAQRRMMQEVPKADVVITNPEHFAVALKYDQESGYAPYVVAKGVDFVAMQIKKVAVHNNVVIVEAPPLARSIYHFTNIDQQIPEGLYLAVAQVLAYVFKLKEFEQGEGSEPEPPTDLDIPENLKRD